MWPATSSSLTEKKSCCHGQSFCHHWSISPPSPSLPLPLSLSFSLSPSLSVPTLSVCFHCRLTETRASVHSALCGRGSHCVSHLLPQYSHSLLSPSPLSPLSLPSLPLSPLSPLSQTLWTHLRLCVSCGSWLPLVTFTSLTNLLHTTPDYCKTSVSDHGNS